MTCISCLATSNGNREEKANQYIWLFLN